MYLICIILLTLMVYNDAVMMKLVTMIMKEMGYEEGKLVTSNTPTLYFSMSLRSS